MAGAPRPINVTYRIHWPKNDEASLQLGETLLKAKRGLPGISDWARAEVVFDSLNPNNNQPLSSVARLYDPLSKRRLPLASVTSPGASVPANYALPASIRLDGVGPEKTFPDLPYYLRLRLALDTQARELTFKGVLDASVSGEPLLLNNVLTSRERDRILELSTDQTFRDIVTALYNLTRNPARADVDGDGLQDAALLTGLKTEYVFGNSATLTLITNSVNRVTNAGFALFSSKVLRDPAPQGSRALTAGQSLPSANLSVGPRFSQVPISLKWRIRPGFPAEHFRL